ncbi:electron transport complex subunit RsxD [Aliikangiella coralliicola]|uniref:Ion-translocating oxidoreductase complex subunit D n=1 Tax=Aliikangiella coralliicola TaxID=2592383 RepID=A0A545UDE4_9GAMM|nr:electron transport complex subunit RsxD [Aliikangiella coralliicola]TQV87485.1 electron transport complex subunit RsxD [Aliikangiella coralliicola]
MKLSSPFFHHSLPTNKVMLLVILALIPGAAIQFYFFGYGVLINLILCSIFAVTAEYFVLYLRNRAPQEVLKDNSALLTGILLGLAIPTTLPIWMTFIGTWFAIIFAKQLYGGLGLNPFNPAMVGYVLLLISFPVEMTAWMPSRDLTANQPSLVQSLELVLFSQTSSGLTVNDFRTLADGYTMATPLDHVKTEHVLGKMSSEIFSKELFQANQNGWMWVNFGYLIGGIYLLFNKVIRWQIPVSLLASIFVTSGVLNLFDEELFSSSWFHLTSGATMLGAFFIATDPVSAATTPKGRLIYGASIGFLVVIIRTFGGYPEAIAFAVLLLNLATPTIDHYTKPTIYGHSKDQQDQDDDKQNGTAANE